MVIEWMNFQGPTWKTLRLAFVMLGVCLAVMLGLAFSSSDSWLVLHVAFLVLITTTLFLLLSWYSTLLYNAHNSFSLKPFSVFGCGFLCDCLTIEIVFCIEMLCFVCDFLIASAVCFGYALVLYIWCFVLLLCQSSPLCECPKLIKHLLSLMSEQ